MNRDHHDIEERPVSAGWVQVPAGYVKQQVAAERQRCIEDICDACGGRSAFFEREPELSNGKWRHRARHIGIPVPCAAHAIRVRAEKEGEK